jgi:hypothetical protein
MRNWSISRNHSQHRDKPTAAACIGLVEKVLKLKKCRPGKFVLDALRKPPLS